MGAALRLLLDTSTVIWAASRPSLLTSRAQAALQRPDNDIIVSAASAWEIATKYRLGRLNQAAPLVADWRGELLGNDWGSLAITDRHALRAGQYDVDHADPFDRMIAAQAELEDLTLVASDQAFDLFPVRRLW